jgi:hypothetical protein
LLLDLLSRLRGFLVILLEMLKLTLDRLSSSTTDRKRRDGWKTAQEQ